MRYSDPMNITLTLTIDPATLEDDTLHALFDLAVAAHKQIHAQMSDASGKPIISPLSAEWDQLSDQGADLNGAIQALYAELTRRYELRCAAREEASTDA
jgi:hypothetical protein